MDSAQERARASLGPGSSSVAVPAPSSHTSPPLSSSIKSSAPFSRLHTEFAQPSPLSTSYTSYAAANGAPSSFSTSINYGSGDEEAAEPLASTLLPSAPEFNKQPRPQHHVVLTPDNVKPVHDTWRDWSPRRPSHKRSQSGGEREEREDDHLVVRRSMDWVRRERPALAGGVRVTADKSVTTPHDQDKGRQEKEKEEKGGRQSSGKGKKDAKHKSESDTDTDTDDETSESDSESSSDSSEDEPLLKKKKKKKKEAEKKRKKKMATGSGNGHGHGEHKEKKKAKNKKKQRTKEHDDDLENQLEHEMRKKKRKKKKHAEGYLPIYLDRKRAVLPLMEPLAQVLGFVGWQITTFVLGLSLGIFLSGITPGYDIADVGINSHWWQAELHKPPFQPPDEMLAPVWISAFCLAAVGMWVVWRRGGWKWNKLATSLYLMHLFVFQIWMCMFFFLHGLLLSVLTSMLGWTFMLVCMIAFYKRSWIAFGLLSFAFAWKSFVVLDVLVIWWLNSGHLAKQT